MSSVPRSHSISSKTTLDRFATDEELIRGMLDSDPAAWRVFQAKYDRLIVRCITKVTRRFRSVVCQDDVLEIFANLHILLLASDMRKLRAFDHQRGSRFSSWIGLLAINAAYDYLRAKKREPQKACLTEALELAAELPDPFELASTHERARLARSTLSAFSKRDRTFAALYFGEGLDPQTIAAEMKISIKTVYSKKHKIQSRLEGALSLDSATRTAPPVAAA